MTVAEQLEAVRKVLPTVPRPADLIRSWAVFVALSRRASCVCDPPYCGTSPWPRHEAACSLQRDPFLDSRGRGDRHHGRRSTIILPQWGRVPWYMDHPPIPDGVRWIVGGRRRTGTRRLGILSVMGLIILTARSGPGSCSDTAQAESALVDRTRAGPALATRAGDMRDGLGITRRPLPRPQIQQIQSRRPQDSRAGSREMRLAESCRSRGRHAARDPAFDTRWCTQWKGADPS